MKQVVFLTLLLLASSGIAGALSVHGLRANQQIDPGGLESPPKLSWKLASEARADLQTSFQIIAASSPELLEPGKADLWDSGEVKGFRNQFITWDGKPLDQKSSVHWKVRVSDREGKLSEWSQPGKFTLGGDQTLSKATRVSKFESSSEGLNQLYQKEIDLLGSRINTFADGDNSGLGNGAEVLRSARALLYHFDSASHLNKWLHLTDQSQAKGGYFPIAPESNLAGPFHSDAGAVVNHPLWWMSGDEALVQVRWKRFENHMIAREIADRNFNGRYWGHGGRVKDTSPEFADLCALGFTNRLVRSMSAPARQPYDVFRFKDYAARIQTSFGKKFVDEKGSLTEKSQSATLLALRSAVLDSKQKEIAIDELIKSLDENGVSVGPIGAYLLPTVLTLTNHHELAIELMSKIPKEDQKFFVGSGGSEWLMSFVAGIDAAAPGFRQLMIAPRIPEDDSLTWVKASHNSPYGEISIHWEKKEKGALKVNLVIPPNCSAKINLPMTKGQKITETGLALKDSSKTGDLEEKTAVGVEVAVTTDEIVSLIARSGNYSFLIE